MKNFQFESLPGRVLFGAGTLTEVSAELQALGARKALVIATADLAELAREVGALLGDLCAGIHAQAVQHIPYETVTEALSRVQSLDVDSLVAVGGGSSIGLAKAIALETSLPILAIPTTYAGSEMTPIWGITQNGVKKTGKNLIVKPKSVIYDSKLTVTLPVRLSVTSGMNAIAHCAEGLYAENANPIISLLAEDGIRALRASLPQICSNPNDEDARSEAQYGTWLGGTVLGSVGMALHHKLCHVLGGSYNLPHAETHTVVLAYAIWYNAGHAPEAMKALARALGSDVSDVAGSIYDLLKSMDAPTSLAEIGMKEKDLDAAAKLATQNPYYNPRPIDEKSIRQLLEYAYNGQRPVKGKAL